MKLFKLLVLAVFIITLFQFNLFSTITIRIEGVVVDEETVEPLEGVHVFLYHIEVEEGEEYCLGGINAYSDRMGKFKFDDIGQGKYFIVILKKGYSSIGPVSRVIAWLPMDLKANIEGVLTTGGGSNNGIYVKGIKSFLIKEGQIKHLRIKLKKEAVLIVKEMVKLPDTSYYVDGSYVFIKHEKYLDRFNAVIQNINGESIYRSNYLPAGKVTVKYGYLDDPNAIKEVTLVNGQTTTVEYVDDYTVGTVLHGIVKDKTTGELIVGASIQLRGRGDGHIVHTNKQGEFWINHIKKSGTYILGISWPKYTDKWRISGFERDERKVEINNNVLNEIVVLVNK